MSGVPARTRVRARRRRAARASTPTRGGPTRPCTARACGRCASSPGFGTAADTNGRFKELLRAGGDGLSTAFDMPTLLGRDSDDPWAKGEVGRAGVAVDTLADMETLFDGIDLGAGLDLHDDQLPGGTDPRHVHRRRRQDRRGRAPRCRARSRTTS